MVAIRTVRTRTIPILMSLAVDFFHWSSPTTTTAFMLVSPRRQIRHQRSELAYGSSSSRRKSVAKDMEDNVLLLPLLEAELAKLNASVALETRVEEGLVDDVVPSEELKDIQRIQELKEAIDNAKTAAEFGVRRVQAEFYDAFSGANFEKMNGVWSRSDDVCCVHPGMESLQGFTAVMQSWEQIFSGYDGQDGDVFQISPSRVKVDICGRTAICTCVEETSGGRLEALNIYRREGGSWKMVNHMASPTLMRS